MKFWRCLTTVLAVAFIVTAMTVDFVDLVKTRHDERTFYVEQQQQEDQATIERKCKAMFPRSGANRRNCIEGDL